MAWILFLLLVLFALSYWVFHEGLGWLSPATSMRLVGALSAAALSWMVYAFVREHFENACPNDAYVNQSVLNRIDDLPLVPHREYRVS